MFILKLKDCILWTEKRKGTEKMSMNNNVNIEKKETAASAEKIDKIVICDDDKDIVRGTSDLLVKQKL